MVAKSDTFSGTIFNDLSSTRRKKTKLSENEKAVLYGLVKHPLLNDRQLAETIDFKMSTLTAIKNRLKKSGFFSTVRLPALNMLDCELLSVSYGSYNPLVLEDERLRIHTENAHLYRNIFYSLWEANQGFSVGIYPNYTKAKRVNEEFKLVYSENHLYDKSGFQQIMFPFEITTLLRFFDFLPLLHRLFEREEPFEEKLELEPEGFSKRRLTKTEKKVLYGLVKYPDMPDKQIAERINVTRQSIARARKDFEATGLIETKRVVNLKKLGYEILALAHVKFRPETLIENREEGIQQVVDWIPAFFWVAENLETMLLGAYQNFEELQRSKMKSIALYKKFDFLKEEPMLQLYSIPNIKFLRHYDYSEMILDMLDIEI